MSAQAKPIPLKDINLLKLCALHEDAKRKYRHVMNYIFMSFSTLIQSRKRDNLSNSLNSSGLTYAFAIF